VVVGKRVWGWGCVHRLNTFAQYYLRSSPITQIFTISAIIKIILDNYGFFFPKLVTHNVKSSRHYVLSVDMAICFLFQVDMAMFFKVLNFF
jgi:hypothetical protein